MYDLQKSSFVGNIQTLSPTAYISKIHLDSNVPDEELSLIRNMFDLFDQIVDKLNGNLRQHPRPIYFSNIEALKQFFSEGFETKHTAKSKIICTNKELRINKHSFMF